MSQVIAESRRASPGRRPWIPAVLAALLGFALLAGLAQAAARGHERGIVQLRRGEEITQRVGLELGKSLLLQPDYEKMVQLVWNGMAHPKLFGQTAVGQPFQAERLLTAALAHHDGFIEIVVVGEDDEATKALLRECYRTYLPTKIVARLHPGSQSELPLFAGRDLVDGRPAAYVCRDFVCKRPVTTVEALRAELAAT